jgi:hypothetical protein
VVVVEVERVVERVVEVEVERVVEVVSAWRRR